ncbi:hypothetical protein [Peribacillus loiseleuriae]|uniref:Aminodeoxychorismate lyase n=1 Tax=Peribacillus loiseleuriae TaxID=1679170 RepID=A0A0K9GXN9_9BACI|nr:hypothetical protein [Peribacillus loiseleuriae]KMY51423.1 hypothetical protein AC625_19315 [Peribacillus loiseleuriae]
MKAQIMRSFAGGLLLATSICGAVYLLGSSKTTQTAVKPSEDEMVHLLTSEGYIIHTEDEWNEAVAANTAPKENTKKETSEDVPQKEKVVYRTILSVSSGMTSIDIEKILKSTKSIDPTVHFSKEVEKRGLSNKLRPGIYQIDSGMTMEEIIAVIFK